MLSTLEFDTVTTQTSLNQYNDEGEHFRLEQCFLSNYIDKKPKFGFNGLGEFVFYRTYSRTMVNGHKETFADTITRVVEGCYEIQRRHCNKIRVPWDYNKAQISAQEMFTLMWEFKFLPPGRGLWMMGTPFMWERGSAALNNCGYVSTIDIAADPSEPFCFLMDMSMLGVGTGFDTKGAGKLLISEPGHGFYEYVIPDSREGWVNALRLLILSYTTHAGRGYITYDPSQVRQAGELIRGFGGKASGPGILIELLESIRYLFERRIGRYLTSVDIADIMNLIGKCIVAGNVRRTAEIAFGEPEDTDYCEMKNPTKSLHTDDMDIWHAVTGRLFSVRKPCQADPSDFMAGLVHSHAIRSLNGAAFSLNGSYDRVANMPSDSLAIPEHRLLPAIETWNNLQHHRWASNNSIYGQVGMKYDKIAQNIAVNGEPGIIWLANIQDYGRMIDGLQSGIDGGAMGSNPCVEQSLESYELCCLVETFPSHHETAEEYLRTLKFAYLYAKTVTLLATHNPRTNSVMLRNRRIGLSQSGIVQAFQKFGRRKVLINFCDAGYKEINRWDEIYSRWLCVTKSLKKTSVKPSGTVSLLAGVTPGIHYPEALTYWRRVRVAKNSVLLKALERAGYHIEPDLKDAERTVVVKFAIDDSSVPSVDTVSIWEQVANAADYQHYWADNQVSCTIKFQPKHAGQIKNVLEIFEDKLKGISFLPWYGHGYAQAPYEPCTQQEVAEYNSKILDLDFMEFVMEDAVGTMGCDGDSCSLL